MAAFRPTSGPGFTRTKGALAVLKAKGRRTGGVPMGSRVGEGAMLAANEAERAAVARARALRSEGKSLRPTAATLDAEGHRPRGKRSHVETLSRVVSAADAPRG